MSWTRAHLDRLTKLQFQIQQLVDEAGTEAVGVDNLVQTNELVAETQAYALLEVEQAERAEHKRMARGFAESLRPFVVSESR